MQAMNDTFRRMRGSEAEAEPFIRNLFPLGSKNSWLSSDVTQDADVSTGPVWGWQSEYPQRLRVGSIARRDRFTS